MKNLIKTKAKKGFSLVELLVVIAVIGIIAAIAIPAMSGIFGEATTSKTKRNAQNIANVVAAARAAGATVSSLGTILTTGVPGTGAMASTSYSAKMTSTEANLASAYLSSTFEYTPAGGQTVLSLTGF